MIPFCLWRWTWRRQAWRRRPRPRPRSPMEGKEKVTAVVVAAEVRMQCVCTNVLPTGAVLHVDKKGESSDFTAIYTWNWSFNAIPGVNNKEDGNIWNLTCSLEATPVERWMDDRDEDHDVRWDPRGGRRRQSRSNISFTSTV